VETTQEPDGGTPAAQGPSGTTDTGAGPDRTRDDHHPSAEVTDTDELVPHDPLRFHQWMKRSATGAVFSGIALGLQQALERKREVPAFVMEAPGEPEDPDAPITLHFDPDDPTKTVAVIRAPAAEPGGAAGA
jgi:hypothetical protein